MRYTHALIDGVEYAIDTDFRTALECQKLLGDPDVSEYEKSIGVIVMLFGEECPITQEAIDKAMLFLRGGDEQTDEEPCLSYEQDWSLIYAAFMSQYKIDLDNDNLHYQQFTDMIKGLKNQAINDLVALRTYDLSEVKDVKQRKKIADKKNKVSLKGPVSQKVSESGFYKALKDK